MPASRREFLAASTGAIFLSSIATKALRRPGERTEVESLLELAAVPGIVLTTIDGPTVTHRKWGTRRIDGTGALDADTRFEAASLSKTVFAAMVHRLAMDGRFDLDQPLIEMASPPDSDDSNARLLTARILLGHGAGWRNWRSKSNPGLRTIDQPGSRFSYSGEGYVYVHRAVEAVTGRSAMRLAAELVLGPAGMARSSFLTDQSIDENIALGHDDDGTEQDPDNILLGQRLTELAAQSGRTAHDLHFDEAAQLLTPESGERPLPVATLPNVAYSLITTPADYASFVRWLLSDRHGSAAFERMTEPVVRINSVLQWGAGIGLETIEGQTIAWQWGDNPGYKNFLAIDREKDSAVIAFTNGQKGRAVYERVIRAETGTDHPGFVWI